MPEGQVLADGAATAGLPAAAPDPAAGLPAAPEASSAAPPPRCATWLRRDASGRWMDAELAARALQLLEPLIIQALVEPAAVVTLHQTCAGLAAQAAAREAASAGGGVLSAAARSLGAAVFREGSAATSDASSAAARARDDPPDSLCDVAVRLQLLLLLECSPAELSETADCDPLTQLQELVLNAACWCPRPDAGQPKARLPGEREETAKEREREEREEDSRRVLQRRRLAHTLSRMLTLAWPALASPPASASAAAAASSSSAAAAPLPSAHAVASILHSMLRLLATAEELEALRDETDPAVGTELGSGRFLSHPGWQPLFAREPLLSAMRACDAADPPGRVACDRMDARQYLLLALEDRTQREARLCFDRFQADADAASASLGEAMGPRVSLGRTVISRARSEGAQQWAWWRHRLYDDHPIWAREAREHVAPAEGGSPPVYRLCDWLDMGRRHMLIVPDPPPADTARRDERKRAAGLAAPQGDSPPLRAGPGAGSELGASQLARWAEVRRDGDLHSVSARFTWDGGHFFAGGPVDEANARAGGGGLAARQPQRARRRRLSPRQPQRKRAALCRGPGRRVRGWCRGRARDRAGL